MFKSDVETKNTTECRGQLLLVVIVNRQKLSFRRDGLHCPRIKMPHVP